MKVVNYFGPPLVKLPVDEHILKVLNHYADQIVDNDNLQKKLDYTNNLSGAVYGGFGVKPGFLKDVEEFVLKAGTEFYEKFSSDKKTGVKIEILSMWFVSQKKESWSYLHGHTGKISGIIYLKMPQTPAQGIPASDPRTSYPGGISFTQGTPGEFHHATVTVKPTVGEMYLFPNNLLHTVYPFFGPEERRSFSFNLSIS
jgi:hypothetical protein